MTQDQLGLYDTSPTRQQIRFGLAITGLLVVGFLLILPERHVRLSEVDSFIPMIAAIMIAGHLITATLLYAQASVLRSHALNFLATGFVFSALLLIAFALTFPGAFAPDGLLGAGPNSAAWISSIRRMALPIAIILYVLQRRRDAATAGMDRPAPSPVVAIGAAIVLAAAVILLATIGHDLLPPFFNNRSDPIYSGFVSYEAGTFLLFVAATLLLFLNRRSVLDLWLLVALGGWLIQSALIMTLDARFTAGWYGLYVMVLISDLIVMLALIAESNRLYARLAVATAARNWERETRLMTMDALAAAISHEVGQPLTAALLNTKAGLQWLTRSPPDTGKAVKAMRDALEDEQRTFRVLKSMRETIARSPRAEAAFSLNDLVRETISLLDRDLTASKASLHLALDETLPPILADRVQIQRVLINLFNNALESMVGTRGRPRRLAIRSAVSGKDVLLEVSDSGVGIAPDQVEQVFETFFTTKATGMGLGLSLCRTIVEEHGGRLWATPGVDHGSTLHMQLPSFGVTEP